MLARSATFRSAVWALLYAGVCALTACAAPMIGDGALPAARPRPPQTVRAGRATSAPALATRCGPASDSRARGYALRPGDWLPALHDVGPRGGGDPRAT